MPIETSNISFESTLNKQQYGIKNAWKERKSYGKLNLYIRKFCGAMAWMSSILQEMSVYYKKCVNEIHKVIISQALDNSKTLRSGV